MVSGGVANRGLSARGDRGVGKASFAAAAAAPVVSRDVEEFVVGVVVMDLLLLEVCDL